MRKEGRIAGLFLFPYLAVFLIFRFLPSIFGIFISFTKWDILGNPEFIAFSNYKRLFFDENFIISLKNTLLLILMTVPPLIVFSLLIAILLNQKLRFKNAVRAIVIIPYILIPAVVGIIWIWLYDNNFGILNYYLKCIGINPIQWLTNPKYALFSVAIVIIWTFVGYNMSLYLAGLQEIPRELYEAALIDGATSLQSFFKITLPLLKSVTLMVVILTLINTSQVFDQIFVMTNGGPGTATLTLVQYLYNMAFQNYNLGYASTIGTVMLIMLAVITGLQFKLFKVDE